MSGRVTLPVEPGIDEELKSMIEKWGADAVRNSDGTDLPDSLKDLGLKVYSTLCMIRVDPDWTKKHPHLYQQKFLPSDNVMAQGNSVQINPLAGYFDQQFAIDTRHEPKDWWQVFDRTTGREVPLSDWSFTNGVVTVQNAVPLHLYSVNVLVQQVWDSTSMYNALINDWESDHPPPIDPYQPEAFEHLLEVLDTWLANNPKTDVVRFTSVAYHFTNIYGSDAEPRYRDWSGYTDCLSPLAMQDFERKNGYKLTSEDLMNCGTMNSVDAVPSKEYLDWINFMNEFVAGKLCKAWTQKVHDDDRTAMMFFCDHWIGTEPYSDLFKEAGFDALVNACKNGTELRRISDVPGDYMKEARLYPYFFPLNLANKPSFADGGNPKQECVDFWRPIRRAMVRKLLDRIGFGGYPSLAIKFPDFIDYAAELVDEFRTMHEMTAGTAPNKPAVKVAVLNAWGKLRSWIVKEYAWGGMMETLSGMAVDVEFINFEDIKTDGALDDIDVIINTGDEGTAWSGGHHWTDPEVTTRIRAFVSNGGGFIGVGEPCAANYQGRFLQIMDVLGVDTEVGMSKGKVKPHVDTTEEHFILKDQDADLDLGWTANLVYPVSTETKVLKQDGPNVHIAVNEFGKGRAVYLAGYKFSWENARMLWRALHWAAGKEAESEKWFSENLNTECGAFTETGKFIVINNTDEPQSTVVHDDTGKSLAVNLEPSEGKWLEISDFEMSKQ